MMLFSGYVLVLPLQFSEQLYCVCRTHAPNGAAWACGMVSASTLLDCFFASYCVMYNVCFFLLFIFAVCECMCSACVHNTNNIYGTYHI